jgi:predicted negative regulator of RcsB-dependent stress response
MTLAQIRDFYRNTGKHMDHATVLHSLKNFNMYRKYNPKLNEYFDEMIKHYELSTKHEKRNSIEHKIKYLSDDNLDKAYALVNKLFTKDLIG